MLDLGALGHPQENPDIIELRAEEAEYLQSCTRCNSCGHLSIFHRVGRVSPFNMIQAVLCHFGCVCSDEVKVTN